MERMDLRRAGIPRRGLLGVGLLRVRDLGRPELGLGLGLGPDVVDRRISPRTVVEKTRLGPPGMARPQPISRHHDAERRPLDLRLEIAVDVDDQVLDRRGTLPLVALERDDGIGCHLGRTVRVAGPGVDVAEVDRVEA
jgi:hypothetical protein